MDNKLQLQKINAVAEEIDATFTEARFSAEQLLIEAYHSVGTLILELPGSITDNINYISKTIGRSDRVLWHTVKLARKFKRVEDIPGGKNLTISKIIREQLTTPKEQAEHVHTPITICSSCRERLDK